MEHIISNVDRTGSYELDYNSRNGTNIGYTIGSGVKANSFKKINPFFELSFTKSKLDNTNLDKTVFSVGITW